MDDGGYRRDGSASNEDAGWRRSEKTQIYVLLARRPETPHKGSDMRELLRSTDLFPIVINDSKKIALGRSRRRNIRQPRLLGLGCLMLRNQLIEEGQRIPFEFHNGQPRRKALADRFIKESNELW